MSTNEQITDVAATEYDAIYFVAVDGQNDFCEGGKLGVDGGTAVMEPLNQMREWTLAQGGTVVASRDWHPKETAHFDKWPVHCVAGTKGAEFHPDLNLDGVEIFSKGQGTIDDGYSAFEAINANGETLRSIIENDPRKRIAIAAGGIAIDFCVKATEIDSLNLEREGVDTYLLTDAIAAVNLQPGDGEAAIKELEAAGAILTTVEEIIKGSVMALRQA